MPPLNYKLLYLSITSAFLTLSPQMAMAQDSHNEPCPSCTDASKDYSHLDWYPSAPTGDNAYCGGRYIEPDFPKASSDPIQSLPVEINAEQGISHLGQGTELSGSVKVVQGQRSLFSSQARIDQATGRIELEGGATYREPGLLLTGKNALSNTNSLETTLNEAEYVLHEKGIRGSVAKVTRNEDSTLSIQRGTYTQCPPGVDSWQVAAGEIHLNPESGFGSAKHATLRVGDVPILYLPYFYFPIDDRRHSGFLYPSLKYSDSEGFDIATPYYFNIAPNMDDTLTPRLLQKRGLMLENEFRYMDQYSINTLSTAYLPNDRIADNDRWLLGIRHFGQPTTRMRSSINYTHVSDDDYFDDLGSDLNISEESHLNRSGSLAYYGNQWQAEFILQSYQTIDDSLTPYRRLPELRLLGQPSIGPDWLSFSYFANYTKFDRDLSGLIGTDRIIGDRLHIEPKLSATFRNTWGYIKPSVKYWHTEYSLDNQLPGVTDSPSVSAPVFSLDTGIYLDKDTTLFGTQYQQTLEPRLFFLYVPEEDQNAAPDFDTDLYRFNYSALFRDNRFSGYDRIGDTQQVSFGVTSRLFDQSGKETVSASVGQALYFKDRAVHLSDGTIERSDYSDIATQINWRPNKRINVSFNGNFTPNQLQNTENNFSVRYQEDLNHIVSLSYRFTEDTREQSTASFIWPISKHWSSLGVWQYDWLKEDDVDLAFGLEYESCCWKTRLITRRWQKDNDEKDTAFYLQFVLKGLGSFGSSGGSDFVEKITGFEQREETNAYF